MEFIAKNLSCLDEKGLVNMSTNQPTNTNAPTPDWREMRRQERAQRRAERGSGGGAWFVGIILIGIGILFLLQNMYGLTIHNWWALFILLPAVGCLAAAWRAFQNSGSVFTLPLLVPLAIGLMLLVVTATFLFDYFINWTLILPAMLILFGVIVLLADFSDRK